MWWMIILGAVLIAATWPLVVLLKAPLWIGVVVTVAVILIVATIILIRFVGARLRAAALERELLRQAQQQAERVRPDRRPEIVALQEQMKGALNALKRSKLAGGGRSALYALPWYVIVGPPAAGKTTALAQSGLGFITPTGASNYKVRGTAGTRNCDWWFSQHAILLDTAGRLATEEDDRDEWMTFLDTLRRFRPSRPLDGLVVAVSVEDLVTQNEDQRRDLVAMLRARADELMSRLEMVLPIYVMFTKIDLLPGFVEFFGDLTKQQRAQAWGASFSLDDPRIRDPQQAVEIEFEVLERLLHGRMLDRLAREPQPEVRARILQFPVEFRPLREPVAHFIEELSQPNPYSENPFVRGFYFSSGTQTGRSIDRVIGNMARGFALGMLATPEARPKEIQSYFVTELFSKVIIPDRHLAARSLSRLRRGARHRLLWVAAAIFVLLLVVTPATLSFVTNTRLVHATERDVRDARALERTGAAAAAANSLDLLLERIERLEEASGELSVRGLLGPYSASELRIATERIYLERLRAMVEGPVQTQLAADVLAIGDLVRTDRRNFQRAYEDLKLYVMLTQPEHLQLEYAKPKLSEVWARALNSQALADQQKLAAHAARYLTALAQDRSWAWKANAASLSLAQGRLSSLPVEELRFGWLAEAAEGAPPIRPEKIFFGAAAQYWTAHGNVEVPGMYTALGWQKVRSVLESPDVRLEFEPWVLGRSVLDVEDSKESAAERLREIYFQRYVAAWSDFLVGLDVLPPQNLEGALEELRVLIETEGPYVRLFNVVRTNVELDVGPTTLLEKGKALLDSAVGAVTGDAGAADAGIRQRPISSVERHFRPLLKFASSGGSGATSDAAPSGLTQYLGHLGMLEVSLTQLAESQQASGAEFASELSRTAAAVQRLLAGTDPRMRMILEPLLMNPIRGSRATVVRADYAQLTGDWRSEVWEVFRTKLKPRYPFSDVPSEVSLPEFADFFRPETGLLWAFVKRHFESRLERSGKAFVPKPSADAVPYSADFLNCLNVSQEITDAVFGRADEPSVQFSVKMRSVSSTISEIALIVDGHPTTYRNEPERWLPITWPGKESPRGAVLRVKGAGFADEIPRMGDFGLFRLFGAGGLKPSGALADGVPELMASWVLTRANEPPVNVTVKPAKGTHPFAPRFFRRLNCPPVVTVGGSAE